MVVASVIAAEAQRFEFVGGRQQWLTRFLQPTAAAPCVFNRTGRFTTLWLRRGVAPRRLWLREIVIAT
jgi:hypothetical protein